MAEYICTLILKLRTWGVESNPVGTATRYDTVGGATGPVRAAEALKTHAEGNIVFAGIVLGDKFAAQLGLLEDRECQKLDAVELKAVIKRTAVAEEPAVVESLE